MDSKEASEAFGVGEKQIGVVGKSATMDPSNEDNLLVSVRVDSAISMSDDGQTDEFKMAAIFSVFKKIFKPHFKIAHLSDEDYHFWVMMEVPKKFLSEEVIVGVDHNKNDGVYFSYDDKGFDGISEHIPLVKVHGEDDEQ